MEASFFSKPLSQSECRIKITSQLLSESECRNLGRDLTQKTQTNKMAEARHNADKHYLFLFVFVNLHIPVFPRRVSVRSGRQMEDPGFPIGRGYIPLRDQP